MSSNIVTVAEDKAPVLAVRQAGDSEVAIKSIENISCNSAIESLLIKMGTTCSEDLFVVAGMVN